MKFNPDVSLSEPQILALNYFYGDQHAAFRYKDTNGDHINFFHRYDFDTNSLNWQIQSDPSSEGALYSISYLYSDQVCFCGVTDSHDAAIYLCYDYNTVDPDVYPSDIK